MARVLIVAALMRCAATFTLPISRTGAEASADDSDVRLNSTVLETRDLPSATAPEYTLNYFRVPKSGSTAIWEMYNQAMDKNPVGCAKFKFNTHDYFPGDPHTDERKSFAVIRNPCERYISQWDFFRAKVHNQARTHCNLQFGSDVLAALETPITWGQYLLKNAAVRDQYLYDRDFVFGHCQQLIILWHQTSWIQKDTQVACLPSMVRDINQILSRELPGCQFEEILNNDRAHNETWTDDTAVCDLAKTLYADDVKLWNEHCGAEHGAV